jgi:cytochrome c peroxidase
MNDEPQVFRCRWGRGAVFTILLIAAAVSMLDCTQRRPPDFSLSSIATVSLLDNVENIPVVIRIFFKPLPDKMPGAENDTPAMIALGRRLYFERGISLGKTQSCNDCHILDNQQAGVDNKPTSPGAKGIAGTRNSPTVLNAGFQIVQFWDGRAPDLVEQTKGPLFNPIEMSLHTEEELVERLKNTGDYPIRFKQAFPDQPQPITLENSARCIAAFERTLITPSRFDRYLRGHTSALTETEKQGLYRMA